MKIQIEINPYEDTKAIDALINLLQEVKTKTVVIKPAKKKRSMEDMQRAIVEYCNASPFNVVNLKKATKKMGFEEIRDMSEAELQEMLSSVGI